jgi:uncharacterized protein with PQ loop repeat
MFPFELEPMLSGLLVGIMFGLVSGISREKRVKQVSISSYAGVIVAFFAISFYLYGYSLDILFEFPIWSSIGFILAFLIILGYRKREDKSSGSDVVPMKLSTLENNE